MARASRPRLGLSCHPQAQTRAGRPCHVPPGLLLFQAKNEIRAGRPCHESRKTWLPSARGERLLDQLDAALLARYPEGIDATCRVDPATVLNSRLLEYDGGAEDSTTYTVDILYEYAFAGRSWRSARHQFSGGSSNVGVGEKRALVQSHGPGSRITAYVNPADPAEAVLERGLTWDDAFVVIPLVFMLFGGIGGAATLLNRRDAKVRPLAASQRKEVRAKPQAAEARAADEPRVRRSQPKGFAFIFLIVFTTLWNLIVWKTSSFHLPGGLT